MGAWPTPCAVLFVAAPGQTALVLDDEAHGAFTFELLRSIREEASRRGARLDEVLRSAWRAVTADARAQSRTQTPAATGSAQRVELW